MVERRMQWRNGVGRHWVETHWKGIVEEEWRGKEGLRKGLEVEERDGRRVKGNVGEGSSG